MVRYIVSDSTLKRPKLEYLDAEICKLASLDLHKLPINEDYYW